jgi:hypothetical protein
MAVKASVQAPFDPRITSITLPGAKSSQKLTRGYMKQAQPLPRYSTPFRFNFLYNPSTVEATYYVQSSGASLAMLFPNPGDASDLAVPINQSVAWTIMYDRTYELNSGAYDDSGQVVSGSAAQPTPEGVTADPTVYGVWADVLQLQFFTGMMLNAGQAQGQNGVTSGVQTPSGGKVNFAGSQGFMMMVPCYVYFGGGTQSNINYYGYVSEWDVTFTHWTQWMVPMRCVIDISFTMLPPPQKTTSTTGSTGAGFAPTPSGVAPIQIGTLPS